MESEEEEEGEKDKVIEEQSRNQIESLKNIDQESKEKEESTNCVIETFMRQ